MLASIISPILIRDLSLSGARASQSSSDSTDVDVDGREVIVVITATFAEVVPHRKMIRIKSTPRSKKLAARGNSIKFNVTWYGKQQIASVYGTLPDSEMAVVATAAGTVIATNYC